MNKQEFLSELREKLSGAPQSEIEDRSICYGEMIDDRIDDGLSQEDAIGEMGSIEDIVAQIKNGHRLIQHHSTGFSMQSQ